MEIIAGTTDFYLEKDTAVAIGKFDGVHLGHRRLLEEILGRKKYGLAACVFTFDPTPAVLFGLSDGKELTTREEKRRLFERLGIDTLIEFPLTKETAATEPECFATEILAKQMKTRFVAAGEDLSFGKNGAGNAELLERMAPHLGFCDQTIEKIEVN
ncbi:MAG: bifunctional riboflavin kinase/FMN adenylyltransferase, partial [Waltera sp.]